jgi:uncharacterized protein YneF (UPF0154 family)
MTVWDYVIALIIGFIISIFVTMKVLKKHYYEQLVKEENEEKNHET